jgi:putative membrane protein
METTMRVPALVAAITLILLGSASAQIGNPAGMTPGTPETSPGVPVPNSSNTEDRLFAMLVGAGGMAEVDFATLADKKAQNPRVKDFARRLIQDHSRANDELKRLAGQAGLPLPNELDPDHKMKRAELDKLSGGAFDLGYMQSQLVDHQKTATLMQWEIGSGQNGDLQRFAAAQLPAILAHLHMAQDILNELTGQGTQGLAEAGQRAAPASTGSRR